MPEAQAFAEAYELAIYKTRGVSFTLSIEKTNAVLFDGHSYAVITAHNPANEPLSKEDNEKRHQALEQLLQQHNLNFKPSVGQSPDGSWSEEGFVVFDIALEQALDIGRMFEQHAILYGQGNRVALAWCESKKLDWFYAAVKSEM